MTTINDNWLLSRARKKRAAATQDTASLQARLVKVFDAEIDALWRALLAETERQTALYSKTLGQPGALTVTSEKDQIAVRASDGRQLTVQLVRERQALMERYRTRTGMVRFGRPRIKFSVSSAGRLVFNFGGPQAAAASVLRRMIE
jgi:hypothetical protein